MKQLQQAGDAGLNSLGDQYEILSEIRRDDRRALYLARHRSLGRDVVISVVRVPGGQANNELTHFTWDARLLATLKHENVVPVVEGRWLDADTFAVVHALVRGSTLGETLAAAGRFSMDKVAASLDQIRRALDWARANGIIHRQLTTDTVLFQQGTGRAMLALGLTPLAPGDTPDACSDVRSFGTMAWSMLAGMPYESNAARTTNLAERRPDLDPAIVTETYAMIDCRADAARRDLAGYIAMLTAPPAAHAAPAYPMDAVPSQSNDAVVVVGRRTSPGPLAFLVVLIAIAALGGYWFLHRGPDQTVMVTSGDTTMSHGEVGDVSTAPMNQAPPTAGNGAMASAPPVAPPIAPPTSSYYPAYPSTPYPSPSYPSTSYTPPSRPSTSSTVPGATTPMTITPPPARRDSVVVTTPPPTTTSTDPCASPDGGDQRRCFDAAIGRGDAELNRTYGDAIAALRRRANVADGEPDPLSVVELRSEQRKWVEDRDAECRRRSDEAGSPLWATRRAECFAEKASARVSVLAAIISG